MTLAPPIKVSRTAIQQARQCGFLGDTEARIRGFFAHSVRTQHQVGNRIYGSYVMQVTSEGIVSFTMLGPRPTDDRPVHACKLCEGLTILKYRNDAGQVSARPCPRAFNPTAPLCDTQRKTT